MAWAPVPASRRFITSRARRVCCFDVTTITRCQ